jgi:hypothetical protein
VHTDEMGDGLRYETEWEDLRLVVERYPEHWQAFVYDVQNCEVLYTAKRITAAAAQLTAVDFALAHQYGPRHDLVLEVVAEMLVWECDVGHAQ